MLRTANRSYLLVMVIAVVAAAVAAGQGVAKAARPATTEQWEWNYYDELIIHPFKFARHAVEEGQKLVTKLVAKPGLHANVTTQSHNTFVFDCVSLTSVIRLDDKIVKIIGGKLGMEAYQCPTH